MKTKKVNNLQDVATIAQHTFFPVMEGLTKSGKKLVYLVTDKRLSLEDFKNLMRDILIAEGYGFKKYYPEHKASYISATGIDGKTLQSLAAAYQWTETEKKEPKTKKPGKGTNTQTDNATSPIDPEVWKQFQAFQAMLKASK